MQSIDIPSKYLDDYGVTIKKELSTISLQFNNGSRPKRFQIYKDWGKTTKQIENKLDDDGFKQNVIQAILAAINENYSILVNNNDRVAAAASAAGTATDAMETESPLTKLDNMSFEEWQTELQARYQKIQDTINQSAMPLCNLWMPLDFALSIKSILHIEDVTEPFAGILVAPASSLKTVTIDLFRKYWRAYHTHDFTPRSWVSHNTSLPEDVLQERVDMLPRVKDHYLLTPELGPTFNANEEELRKNFANLSAVLDGKGLETNSGGFGRRGYHGEYNFMWLGAIVKIRPHVYNMMGNLGPKIHFLRLPWRDRTEKELIQQTMEGRFQSDHDAIEQALYDYLKWFEACPIMNGKNGLPKVTWDTSKNDYKAVKLIARLAKLLSHLRGAVDTWYTTGSQGSDYAYDYRSIEEADRANRMLTNLARGHALSQGRTHITMDDIPLLTKVVLSTAPMERVAVFELLLKNGGSLDVNTISDELRVSEPTARRTMTELFALGLVDRHKESDFYNSNLRIDIVEQFRWCLGRDFRHLLAGFSPTRISSKRASLGKRSSKRGDNVDEDSTKLKEKIPPHPHKLFFWQTIGELENKQRHLVSESLLKSTLVSSGKFIAGEAAQIIKDNISEGNLVKNNDDLFLTGRGYNILVNNSPSGMSKN